MEKKDKKILNDVIQNIPREPISRPAFLSRERRDELRTYMREPVDPPPVRSSTNKNKLLWLAGIVLVLTAGILLANNFASATIAVTPTQKSTRLDTTLKAYKSPEAPHLLGYNLIEVADEESDIVPSTGIKYVERKATGKITVYNNYSSSVVRFVANTRFKSTDGKVFRSYNTVVIPGNGSIEISVIADAPGETYNIGPSDFTLPGLVGGAMYTKISGKSAGNMTGGFKGDVNVVSDEDLSKVKAKLEIALTTKLLEQIQKNIGEGNIFFRDSYSIKFVFNEFAENDNSENLDTDSKTQKVTLSGNMSAVIFDKKALATSIARRELSGVGEEEVDISNWEAISMDLTHYDNLDVVAELTIRITGDANFVWLFNESGLRDSLAGIPKADYSRVLLDYPGINKAEIKIKPFWRKTFPSSPERIKVTIALDG